MGEYYTILAEYETVQWHTRREKEREKTPIITV
jgi:hypothetical protein